MHINKPKLLYYSISQYQPENMQKLRDKFELIELTDPSHDKIEILQIANVIIAPLGYLLSSEKIDVMDNLDVVASNTTGEQHIDVEHAQKKGIKVISLKGERDFLKEISPTAEHALGLIIALTRNLIPAQKSVTNGEWNRRPFGGKQMLSRMTLGIAGCGRLGQMMCKIGLPIFKTVQYFDDSVAPEMSGVHKCNNLVELVNNSDVVSIHLPLLKNSKPTFTNELLSKCKKGMYLVNTSRGEIVDSLAIIDALESNILDGYATDVLDGEFSPEFNVNEHPLVKYAKGHSNVLITPHIAGSTKDAWLETETHVINRILKFYEDGVKR